MLHVKRLTICVATVAAYSFPALAGECTQAGADKYIRDSESAWAESVATNDTSVVKRILADDFVWVLDGRVLDKPRAVAEAAAGPSGFKSDHVDYIHIRFYGTTAVAQGAETWVREQNGVTKKGKFVWTDTWVCRSGNWQIVSAEDDVVPMK